MIGIGTVYAYSRYMYVYTIRAMTPESEIRMRVWSGWPMVALKQCHCTGQHASYTDTSFAHWHIEMLIWIHLAHFEVISRPSPPFSTSGFRACVTHIRRDAILKKEEAFFEPFQTSRSLPKTRRIKKRTRIHSTASMKWLMFVLMNFWNCQLWVDNSENHSTLGSFAVKSTVIYIYTHLQHLLTSLLKMQAIWDAGYTHVHPYQCWAILMFANLLLTVQTSKKTHWE